ncbi:MAG TPA: hypothetical protein GX707_06475 [Epulopiscium sp.]|nr:hypothetical protein [Candidatus Epulonipiscium sp.]
MYLDKNGIEIKEGQTIVLSNSRKDYENRAKVENIGGELKYRLLDGVEKGKLGSIKYKVSCIYWAEDIPENCIEVIKA